MKEKKKMYVVTFGAYDSSTNYFNLKFALNQASQLIQEGYPVRIHTVLIETQQKGA